MTRYRTVAAPAGALLLACFLVQHAGAQERMPPLPIEKMTDAQKKAVAEYTALRNADPAAPPWSVLLRVPALLVPALQMRLHYLSESAVGQRLSELAILIAARRWTNNFEWNAHYNAALTAGLKPDIIAAIAEGRRPERMADDEAIVYDFCIELHDNQSVSDATYTRALAAFGEPGIVEIASLEGYYAYLAMVMNVARIGVPAGAKPALERFPR